MRILAFDTALGPGSAAVWADGQILASGREDTRRALAEKLVPLIESVLAQSGLAYEDLDRLAVTVGPGTFTGLRVGLATARGLALATGLPLLGLSTLETLAWAAKDRAERGDTLVVSLDARCGELFQQAFEVAGDGLEALGPPLAYPLERAGEILPKPGRAKARILCLGSGVPLLQEACGAAARTLQQLGGLDEVDAAVLAGRAALLDPSTRPPEPLYLRAPDAKLPKAGLGLR